MNLPKNLLRNKWFLGGAALAILTGAWAAARPRAAEIIEQAADPADYMPAGTGGGADYYSSEPTPEDYPGTLIINKYDLGGSGATDDQQALAIAPTDNLLTRQSIVAAAYAGELQAAGSFEQMERALVQVDEEAAYIVAQKIAYGEAYAAGDVIAQNRIARETAEYRKAHGISESDPLLGNDKGTTIRPTWEPEKPKTVTYSEGGITYENRDGKIYKDGREIPKENYKYIPAAVGGSRGH